MTVSAFRTPTTLTLGDFTPQPVVLDHGLPVDAFTTFDFSTGTPLTVAVGSRFRVNPAMVILITPVALVRIGALMTPALLAHEQIHYDVGFVIARQLAREFNAIDDANDLHLQARMRTLVNLHFTTRAGLIQTRYDRESNHSLNAHFQKYWSDKMAKCLADPKAHEIGGWML